MLKEAAQNVGLQVRLLKPTCSSSMKPGAYELPRAEKERATYVHKPVPSVVE